jgi:hypothetical protein
MNTQKNLRQVDFLYYYSKRFTNVQMKSKKN